MGYEIVLCHHGIAKQKWGVRNGPPYPLDYEDHSQAQKRQLSKYHFTSKPSQKPTNKTIYGSSYYAQKGLDFCKIIGHRLPVVGLPFLAAEGMAYLAKRGSGYIKDSIYQKSIAKNDNVDPKTGLKKKQKDMTERQDLSFVNPGFQKFGKNTKNNCMLCTTAYDLRRRGFDVTAGLAKKGFGVNDLLSWYPKGKINRINLFKDKTKNGPAVLEMLNPLAKRNYIKEVEKQLISSGENSRGNIMVRWDGLAFAGHSMIYEVNNGKVKIMDGQTNRIYSNIFDSPLAGVQLNSVSFMRFDNVEPNYSLLKKEGYIR